MTDRLTDQPAAQEASPEPESPRRGTDREFTVAEVGQARLVLRRFLRHRAAVVSLVVLVLLLLLAYVGGGLWHYKYGTITPDNSVPPSLAHPFGTNSVGKDEFAEVLRGTQISFQVSVVVAVLAAVVGTIYGAAAGYFRGWVDTVLMRIADLILTVPLFVVAAVLAHNVGGTWWLIALIIGGLYIPYVARVSRGVTLSLREKEFVEAARALGAGDWRIILRHLVPNALGSVLVNATILVALAILLETSLSFLGFGVAPPDTSLGLLVTDGQTAVDTRPWLFYFPGLFIILIALTVNFIGDGLRDALDPQQTKVRQ